MQEPHDVFSNELQIPGLPSKVHYSMPQQPAYVPRIPQPNVSSLNAVERTHVQSEQKTAQDQDQQLYQVTHIPLPLCSCVCLRLSKRLLMIPRSRSLPACPWPADRAPVALSMLNAFARPLQRR